MSVVREQELSGVRLSLPGRWTLSSWLWGVGLSLVILAMVSIGLVHDLVELWALALVPAVFLLLHLLTRHTHRPATVAVDIEALSIGRPRFFRWRSTTRKIPLHTIARSRLITARYAGEGATIRLCLDSGEVLSFGFGHTLEGLRQVSEEIDRALRIHGHAPAERGSIVDIPQALRALRETPSP